jgi:hypothetical protein
MVAVAMVAAMVAQAGSRKPRTGVLVTVFTYDRAGVPGDVMLRAKLVVTMAYATAGIEVRWAEGKRLGEPREVASGEVLTVVFDGPAPAQASSQAMAFTNMGGGADANVHVFYNRVAGFAHFYWSGAHLSELLGNVLAHELTHALEGVARHSSEGLMKANWSGREYAEMAERHPLAFAAEDLELLRAHFKNEMSPAPSLVATR